MKIAVAASLRKSHVKWSHLVHNFRFARAPRLPCATFSAPRNRRGFSSKKLENRGRSPFYPRVSESRSKWSVSVLVRWPSWWRRRSTNSQWRWTSRSSPRCHLWTQCCSPSSDSSTVDHSSIIRPGIFPLLSCKCILTSISVFFIFRIFFFFFYSHKIVPFTISLFEKEERYSSFEALW